VLQAPSEANPERVFVQNAAVREILELVRTVKNERHRAARLLELDGHSYQEIANRLGNSVVNARQQAFQARRIVRSKLEALSGSPGRSIAA
jgi:DNA-directed RNA polymerase specialized sigma24 family protein